MIKYLIKLIFLFSITASYSQNSINSAGGDLQAPSVNMSYSIGQLKINSIKTSFTFTACPADIQIFLTCKFSSA